MGALASSIAGGDDNFKSDSFKNFTGVKGSKDGQFSSGSIGEAEGMDAKGSIMKYRARKGVKGSMVYAVSQTQNQQEAAGEPQRI